MRANRRQFIYGAGVTAAFATARSHSAHGRASDAWQCAADIARNVRAPTFPDRVFDITAYGAKPDASTLSRACRVRSIFDSLMVPETFARL